MTITQAPRRRDAEENRAGILVAAVEMLAADPNASVDTIAKAAGLSRRALYGHFDDRETLIRAVIDSGAESFNDIASSITDEDPRLALAHLATALWTEGVHVHAAAALALDERLVKLTAEALAPLRARVLAICERGADMGVLRTDIPPHLTARLVEEAARGVITRISADEADRTQLAMRAVLGAAGLDWQTTDDLIKTVSA